MPGAVTEGYARIARPPVGRADQFPLIQVLLVVYRPINTSINGAGPTRVDALGGRGWVAHVAPRATTALEIGRYRTSWGASRRDVGGWTVRRRRHGRERASSSPSRFRTRATSAARSDHTSRAGAVPVVSNRRTVRSIPR